MLWLALSLALGGSVRAAESFDPARWVDPFIGTGGHGHTYPGASRPFGMVQLSPDTRNDHSWDSCAGYHYSDSSILGFSHTHLSGVGVPDYGDILLQPITGEVRLQPGDPKKARSGYRSRFRHGTEKAEPGYYTVVLDDYQVRAELTATDRVGFHRYTFQTAGRASFLLDLIHRDPVTESCLRVVSERRIEGLRRAKFWAGDQYHYFAMEFSRPVLDWKLFEQGQGLTASTAAEGKALQALASFQVDQGQVIEVKVATSAVSAEGAWKNLEAEGGESFDQVRQGARAAWNRALGKLRIEGGTPKERRIFYSALYHTLLTPNLYQDVDGRYRGMDGAVHQAVGFTNYTVFSLWDTFRGLHPLLTILEPERDADFVKTLINMSRLFGELPMWELAANDTRCMIGYHAAPVIADAWAKGITNFDLGSALVEMKRTARLDKRGLKDYRTLGYVPANKGSQAVSKTLEYAYDDWCIAQVAKALGQSQDYAEFLARSQFYRNIFDPAVGFMRGKDDAHAWSTPFDPQAPGLNYTEGNAYQYSLFVPHDVPGLAGLLGGKAGLARYLDRLFTTKMTIDLGEENDISGLIGQYAHGNEPSHHLAYLYALAGQPAKAQAMVRRILQEQYDDTPAGLNGNEDCGQMSAWYVLSALGFYSVCPGQSRYVLGSPLFEQAELQLANGKRFTIRAQGNRSGRPYLQSARLNGAPLDEPTLDHFAILAGGELELTMGARPGAALSASPTPMEEVRVTPVPYLVRTSDKFLDKAQVEMRCAEPEAEIFYSLDGSTPDRLKYEKPFEVNATTTIKLRACRSGAAPSLVVSRTLTRSTALTPDSAPVPGLGYRYYEGIYRSVYDFAKDPVAAAGVVARPTLEVPRREHWFGLAFDGLIQIPQDGEYTFYVAAKDGGQLMIDGEEQFESDGRKDQPLPQQSTVALCRGFHRFSLKFYKCTDNIALTVDWSGPGISRAAIPAGVFFHESPAAFLPLGIYGVRDTNDFPEIKAAGFNLVVGQAERGYLEAARQCGLQVLAAPRTAAGPGFNPGAAAQAVRELDAHPALWAWYLADEPDLNGIAPAEVARSHRAVKEAGARKPTALVLYRGYEALDYAHLSDLLMVDRYPVPWLPLASLGQHVQMGRLALGQDKPLLAVIQAFDWSSVPEMLPGESGLRPPTGEEMRCMTYDALAQGATGLFYFAFESGWKMREHPETWAALKAVVQEVNDRRPLFLGQRQWWPRRHQFAERQFRFNAALASSISSVWLKVASGNGRVPAGDYILAVNTTEHALQYSFLLPAAAGSAVPVLGEGRSLLPQQNRLSDRFERYAVHVYGPLRGVE